MTFRTAARRNQAGKALIGLQVTDVAAAPPNNATDVPVVDLQILSGFVRLTLVEGP